MWMNFHLVSDNNCNIVNLQITNYSTRINNIILRFTFSLGDTTCVVYN